MRRRAEGRPVPPPGAEPAFFVVRPDLYAEVLAMPKDPRPSRSALACRRSFEPARLQQQLRSQAYERLVPVGSRPTPADRNGLGGRNPSTPSANPCGGICA